ncbi:hypothetical protein Tco_0956955, partial [Tanacetum coccineum]
MLELHSHHDLFMLETPSDRLFYRMRMAYALFVDARFAEKITCFETCSSFNLRFMIRDEDTVAFMVGRNVAPVFTLSSTPLSAQATVSAYSEKLHRCSQYSGKESMKPRSTLATMYFRRSVLNIKTKKIVPWGARDERFYDYDDCWAFWRGLTGCKQFKQLRRKATPVKIQKEFKRFIASKSHQTLRVSTITLQTGLRAMTTCDEFRHRNQTMAAICMQVQLKHGSADAYASRWCLFTAQGSLEMSLSNLLRMGDVAFSFTTFNDHPAATR